MDLQGGKPYNYMLEHFFPELRNSVSTVLYLHIVAQQDSETEPEPIAVVPSEEERAAAAGAGSGACRRGGDAL